MSYKGKISVVTGATSGIGLVVAQHLASLGSKVVIVGRNQTKLDKAVSQVGQDATGILADSTNLKDLTKLFSIITEKFGKIDNLILNAGAGEVIPLDKITEVHYDNTFNLNVKGTLFAIQGALPLLGKGSSVVLIGSTASMDVPAGMSVYGGTKAALTAMIKGWIKDTAGKGIRINIVSPGPVRTEALENFVPPESLNDFINHLSSISPVGRIGAPIDIARAVAFISSEESGYINGIEFFVDGGASQI